MNRNVGLRKARATVLGKTRADFSSAEAAAVEAVKSKLGKEYWNFFLAQELSSFPETVVKQRNLRSIEELVEKKSSSGEVEMEELNSRNRPYLLEQRIKRTNQLVSLVARPAGSLALRQLSLLAVLLFYDLPDNTNGDEIYRLNGSVSNYKNLAAALAAPAVIEDNTIRFYQFYCPKIDPSKLVNSEGNSAGDYVSLEINGNNFQSNASRLRSMVRALKKSGIKVELTLVAGDTDEEDYLFPPLSITVDQSKLRSLHRAQATLIEGQAKILVPELDRITVELWSEIQEKTARRYSYVPSPDFENKAIKKAFGAELSRMRKILNTYYDGKINPTDNQLSEIVTRKFITYRRQGYVLSNAVQRGLFFGNIFLNAEFPRGERLLMLGIEPALCPYIKEDSPY